MRSSALFFCMLMIVLLRITVPGQIQSQEVGPGFLIGFGGLATSNQKNPSVAFDGTNYFVVWEDNRTGLWQVYGARVSPSGAISDLDGIAISASPEGIVGSGTSVAFDGANYLSVWTEFREGWWQLWGARVSPSGEVLDSSGIYISDRHPLYSSIAFGAVNYLVAWQCWVIGCYDDVLASRVSPSGEVLDPSAIQISANLSACEGHPAVAFDGTNYFVVWDGCRWGSSRSACGVHGSRISPSGIVLDTAGIAVSTARDEHYPSVAFDNTNYLVVWEDHWNGARDVCGTRVGTSGVVVDSERIVISAAAGFQSQASISFDGTCHLVVWKDTRTGSADIYGARVVPSGDVLDPEGIAISTGGDIQKEPAVGSGSGGQLLVVYSSFTSSPYNNYRIRGNFCGVVPEVSFVRGDVNNDMDLSMGDVMYLLWYLYVPGTIPPRCEDGCDVDDSGEVDMSDAIYILKYLYVPGSPEPSFPFPECGSDPTEDELGCEYHPCMSALHPGSNNRRSEE